ncbi:unnamed protein product [Oppiella nova]|uniref:Uncharacterized protein n=1 Tax=Oppiella nova TaxID=334625 RepID=A0A7R9LAM0_9ACAR|nr:unnamed protein product [Oppiella nova]CAG2161630.1 unnamed protein product [Oppiella nova]
MTRVWSLSSTNETQESQLLIIWKHESNLLSFDSGYQSSISHSLNDVTEEFDNHFNDFEELEDYSHVNEENRYQESSQQVTHVLHSRVQSSPIPIPQTSRHHKSSINHSSSSLSSHSDHSFTSSEQSLHSIDSVHCLIGHPPYDCGCIRGYRYPFMATNVTQQTQSSLQTDY